MRRPVVALVGAPNVGKSTLFNRLVGRDRSLVHPRPGMTRDRVAETIRLDDREAELIDTGGMVPASDEGMDEAITLQAREAARLADLVLLVVDGRVGTTPVDQQIAALLRRAAARVVVVVNKLDTPVLLDDASTFFELGIADVVGVSAAHGLAFGELRELIMARLPAATAAEVSPSGGPALGLVGRPNVGKSSILNRLLNEERVLVSETPGTTRDAVDTYLRAHGCLFRLVDTAGLRRRKSSAPEPESLAMERARKILARVDVAVLVMDAVDGITTGDIAIAGMALAAGRAVLPVVNKWDVVEDRAGAADRFRHEADDLLKFLPDSSLLRVSARTGLRVRRILQEAASVAGQFAAERPTSAWNRALRQAVVERRPPLVAGRPFRFYYAVQTGTRPPAVDLFVNSSRTLPESYRRFIENRLRRYTGLGRTPIRLTLRPRTGGARRRPGRARA